MRKFYQNPLNIKHIGDPFVLKTTEGKYYCYPTSDINVGFKAWSSENLVDWKEEGHVYLAGEDAWGHNRFWAPEVVEHEGKFYMYYTAGWKKNNSLRIGVAVSQSPTGPFIDVKDGPMFDFGYAAIDAHVYIDEDDKKYLYFSRDCSENVRNGVNQSEICGIELDDNMIDIKGEPVLLASPEQLWELKSVEKYNRLWNEGPFVLKKNGIYYLMYSGNCFASEDYALGYATSRNPLGPFIKYENNPVLASNGDEISGPGHHSVTTSLDGKELFVVYHIHTNPKEGGGDRQVCIDRMGFQEDGSIYIYGPTNTEQQLPSGV